MRSFRETFSPLRTANFRTYMTGQGISMIGMWMQSTAQSWVVWQLSNSTAALGTVAMLSALPTLLLGPLAGVWADRMDRRRLLAVTKSVSMLLAIALALLVQADVVQLWHVYVLAGLLGCVNAFDGPAQQAFIGDLSGMHQLRKAVTINAMAIQVSRTVGPAVAGWLIGVLGVAAAFWLNGVAFLVVIATLLRVRAEQVLQASSGDPISEFVEGLRFIRSHARVQDLIITISLTMIFGYSSTQLFPPVVTEILKKGPETLGLLMGAFGAGALISALLVVPAAQRSGRIGLMLSGAVIWIGTWFFLFSFSTSLPFSVLAIFLAAFGHPMVLATSKGLLQVLAPPNMRARLLTAQVMISVGLQPVASLSLGYAAQYMGSLAAIRGNSLLMLGGAVLMLLLRPAWRAWRPDMNAESPEPAKAEPGQQAAAD